MEGRGGLTECPWMEVEPAAEQTSKASQGPEQHCSILEPHPPCAVRTGCSKEDENKTRPLCTTTLIHNKLETQNKGEIKDRGKKRTKERTFGVKSAKGGKKNRTGVR